MALNSFFRFGFEKWFPEKIPAPTTPEITIDAKNKSDQSVICEVIEQNYKVIEDSNRLRNSPSDFELQRGNYPIRREFQAYTVVLKNGNSNLISSLKRIGFSVKNSEL